MTSQIETLAHDLLDDREIALAKHIRIILNNNRFDSGGLLADILPRYSEKVGKYERTLDPDPIYRPLYYIHTEGGSRHFKRVTRNFIRLGGDHLEGCLAWLTPNPPQFRGSSKPMGALIYTLRKNGVLPPKLADDLARFNREVYIPTKHFEAFFTPRSRLDERTFSVQDSAFAFMITRKLAMQLFQLLTSRGVSLPSRWKDMKGEWLSWRRTTK